VNGKIICVAAISALGTALWAQQLSGQQQAQQPMRFFVASTVPATGNLGGLAGADQICQNLAAAAGAGDRTWRAYLSTQEAGGQPAINARDRIGVGPWHNAKGVQIAPNVVDLHGDNERDRNYLFKDTALDEKGNLVNGRGDTPNVHDMLTGSDSLGRALRVPEDRTCRNWTSDSPNDSAMVGHHDRSGGGNTSWNSVHATPGCHAEGLIKVGGGGRVYCFAIN
jgi:hypothetical protein